MTRFHATAEGNVPFTAEEEAARDAEEAVVAAAAIAAEAVAYKAKRAAEYPPMADYLDGIVKGDTAQVQTYIDACLAIKTKYPKP
jgi:membrane protein involved in colicin uptake